MNHPWVDAVAVAVAEGRTDFQFAVPDGKFIGDLYFVTDTKHRIIVGLMWTGERWMSEHDQLNVQQPTQRIKT